MQNATTSPEASLLAPPPCPPRILCYGHDPVLLYTRKQILVRLGWTVDLASNSDEYRDCVQKKATSVVVCCQTLAPEQVLKAVILAEKLRLPTRFLVMFIRMPPIADLWGCLMLPTEVGPQAFGRAVFHLLQGSFEEELAC